tara:strand:+ start:1705 stop:2337 length:633 start_codon:yes stop_codon:yes gene_type:complete
MVQQMMRQLQGEKDEAKAAAEAPPKAIRQPRRKKAPEPEPESDSGESSSSYDSYESVEKIHKKFDDEPCEAVSPAMLKSKLTKKEAVKYLESKECPKIPSLKKKQMNDGPASPAPETAPAKKVRKVKAAPAPVAPAPAPEPVAAPKAKKVKAAPAPAPVAEPAPAAAAPKAKRPASEYAKLVGKYRKEKMSFADAAKRAKAELDAKKKKD